ERLPAGNAHPRHPAPGWIVDSGMDHLAVAGGGYRTDAFGLLQHHHLAAGLRQPPCQRKADHPGPDNDALDLVHVKLKSEKLLLRQAIPAAGIQSVVRDLLQPSPWDISQTRSRTRLISEALIMSGQLPQF